jgi:hypothetical protein
MKIGGDRPNSPVFSPHSLAADPFTAPALAGYRRGMSKQQPKQQHFWNVDLIELVKMWGRDMSTFLQTALLFAFLAMPVVIPTLILWYLLSIDFKVGK